MAGTDIIPLHHGAGQRLCAVQSDPWQKLDPRHSAYGFYSGTGVFHLLCDPCDGCNAAKHSGLWRAAAAGTGDRLCAGYGDAVFLLHPPDDGTGGGYADGSDHESDLRCGFAGKPFRVGSVPQCHDDPAVFCGKRSSYADADLRKLRRSDPLRHHGTELYHLGGSHAGAFYLLRHSCRQDEYAHHCSGAAGAARYGCADEGDPADQRLYHQHRIESNHWPCAAARVIVTI